MGAGGGEGEDRQVAGWSERENGMGEKYFRFSTVSAAGSVVSRDPSTPTGCIETHHRVARSIPAPTTAM